MTVAAFTTSTGRWQNSDDIFGSLGAQTVATNLRVPSRRVALNRFDNNEAFVSVSTRLGELCALPVGWDGYGGKPTSYQVARFAESLLQGLGEEACEHVSITPCSDGELLLEWHLLSGDVELQIVEPYVVYAEYETPEGEEEDGVFSAEYTKVSDWLSTIFQRRCHALQTAA